MAFTPSPGLLPGRTEQASADQRGWVTDRPRRTVIAQPPFGRFGQAHELMGAVLYLCANEAAGFVTGITIPVDGGYLARTSKGL